MADALRCWLKVGAGMVPALLATALCATAGAAPAKTPTKPAATSAAHTAKPVSAGFAIAPRPAWVQAVSLDGLPALPEAPIHVLLMDEQTRLAPGGSVRYEHGLRQVNSSAGLEAASQLEFVFDPSYEQFTLHDVAIWRGGKRIDRLDRKAVKLLQRETQLERQIVDGRMTAAIVLEDLRVGDRIEWAASLSGDNPVFEGKFVDIQWLSNSRGPAGLVQRRLLAPPERRIRHRVTAAQVELSEQTRPDGWRETVLRRRAVPQFRFNPQVPAEDNYADLLEWSEFESWAEVAAWAERQFDAAQRDREPLAATVAEIRAASPDPAQQLNLALDFVQQQIRYFGTEIGASSHRPASAAQVMRNRFGDCKDKSALLVNLLGLLGIEARPALVSTQLKTSLDKRLPSPLAFDHAIVAVKREEGKWLWLDATRSLQTGPATERGITGLSPALLARAGEAQPLALPAAQEQLRAEVLEVFKFPRLAEPGELLSEAIIYGDLAEHLRLARANQPAEAMDTALATDLQRSYPGYQRVGPAQIEELPGRNALKISQRLQQSGEYWRLAGQGVLQGDVVQYAVMSPLRLPDMNPREQALALQALPGRYRQTVRFEFGEPVFSRDSEAPFSETNGFFDLRLRTRGSKQQAEFKAELLLRSERIEPSQWTAYRDALQKVWPRLAMVVGLPVIAPDRGEALRRGMNEMAEGLRSGRVKAVTKVQAEARYRLLLADQQLAGGRLPPKLRAQVLVERGVQLDHLGMQDAARIAFEEAGQLDPSSAAAQAGLATNALARGQDAELNQAVERALQLAPSDSAPRYTRAKARYMAGDFAAAGEELQALMEQSGSEVERSYRAVWLFLARQAQNQSGAQATASALEAGDKPSWPQPVLRMLRGDLTMAAALDAARSDKAEQAGRECELYFFAAQKALLERDGKQARHWLERSLATGVVEFIEYGLAKREQARQGR